MNRRTNQSMHVFSKWGSTLIHWRSQGLANVFFGLPCVLLLSSYVGLDLATLVKLFVFFMSVSISVWGTFWFFYGRLKTQKIRKLLLKELSDEKLTEAEVIKLLTFLVNYPRKTALEVFAYSFIAYLTSVLMLRAGVIPEIMPIIGVVTATGLAIGVVVAPIEAIFNYALLTDYSYRLEEHFIAKYGKIIKEKLAIQKISLFTKMLVLAIVTAVSVQIVLLTVVLGRVAIMHPNELVHAIKHLTFFIIFASGYGFVISKIFTHNISYPLRQLTDWSGEIPQGKLDKRINTVTDDELNDVIINLEKMVDELQYEKSLISIEKDQLAIILANIEDGVIALDQNFKTVVINKAASNITQWTDQEVVGQHISQFLTFMTKTGREMSLIDELKSIEGDQTKYFTHENRVQLVIKNLQRKYVNLILVRIEHKDIADVAYLLMFHDISSEHELERMKLDFVAMSAHELRTPLTSIRGYLELLKRDTSPKLNPDEQQILSRIEIATIQLTGLMENILSVSKIESGTYVLNTEAVDWLKLIQERIEEFQSEAQNRNLTLTLLPPDHDIPLVEVDLLRITEVLNNLITNALHYTRAGSVAITVEHNSANNLVVTHITDTGQGIPPDALPHMFEKFFRVSGMLEQGSKGTGLGLYIAKSIVTMHKGEIWVDSTVNEGSTFSFSLPVSV